MNNASASHNAQYLIDLRCPLFLRYTTVMNTQYFAGFFDADGCVVAWMRHPNKHRNQYPVYGSRINFSNTNLSALERMRDTLGGIGTVRPESRVSPRPHPLYYYDIGEREAEPLMREMLPHLLIKRERVIAALELIEHKRMTGGRPLTPELVAERAAIWDRVKARPIQHVAQRGP